MVVTHHVDQRERVVRSFRLVWWLLIVLVVALASLTLVTPRAPAHSPGAHPASAEPASPTPLTQLRAV